MEINKIVYMCKDNISLLDEMLKSKVISLEQYNEAKRIIGNNKLCREACEEFVSGNKQGKAKTNKKVKNQKMSPLKKGMSCLIILVVLALSLFIYHLATPFYISLGTDVVAKVDPNKFSGEATAEDIIYYSNIGKYQDNKNYDDMVKQFEEDGLTSEEANSLVPTYGENTNRYLKKLDLKPEVSVKGNIKNGDVIKVKINYNKLFAMRKNIKLEGTEFEFQVKGLKERVTADNYAKADPSNLNDFCRKYLTYDVFKNSEYIHNLEDESDVSGCQFAIYKETKPTQKVMAFRSGLSTQIVDGDKDYDPIPYYVEAEVYIQDGKYMIENETMTTPTYIDALELPDTLESYPIRMSDYK